MVPGMSSGRGFAGKGVSLELALEGDPGGEWTWGGGSSAVAASWWWPLEQVGRWATLGVGGGVVDGGLSPGPSGFLWLDLFHFLQAGLSSKGVFLGFPEERKSAGDSVKSVLPF